MGLMNRVELAVEDYLDACAYTKLSQLTTEDIAFLGTELQINPRELKDLLGL